MTRQTHPRFHPRRPLEAALVPRILRMRRPTNQKVYQSVRQRWMEGKVENPAQGSVPWYHWTTRWDTLAGRWQPLPWRLPQRPPPVAEEEEEEEGEEENP